MLGGECKGAIHVQKLITTVIIYIATDKQYPKFNSGHGLQITDKTSAQKSTQRPLVATWTALQKS